MTQDNKEGYCISAFDMTQDRKREEMEDINTTLKQELENAIAYGKAFDKFLENIFTTPKGEENMSDLHKGEGAELYKANSVPMRYTMRADYNHPMDLLGEYAAATGFADWKFLEKTEDQIIIKFTK